MSDIADRQELLLILTEKAREGHVTACRTLLEELRRDDVDDDAAGDGFAALDNVTSIKRAG